MRRTPRIWQGVPWRVVQALRRAGLRPQHCQRPGAIDITPQRIPKLGMAKVQGVLYWIPRWNSDGPALYLARADHWDRAANASVIVSAVGLTSSGVVAAARDAIRQAAEVDLCVTEGI